MKKLSYYLLAVILLSLLVIITANLAVWQPKKDINVFILDKSIRGRHSGDHHAIHWLLDARRIVKSNDEAYSSVHDYYGFIPQKPYQDKNYIIRPVNIRSIDSITLNYDVFYFADTYGVFFSDWFNVRVKTTSSNLIYGGLNQNEYLLLRNVVSHRKKLILEHNLIYYPTNQLIRKKTEELTGIYSSEWQAKFIPDLKVSNNGHSLVPEWVVQLYEREEQVPWAFTGSGFVFAKGFEKVAVLTAEDYFDEVPLLIKNSQKAMDSYGLPEYMPYAGSFHFVDSTGSNIVMSELVLNLNEKGMEAMEHFAIPVKTPFMISSPDNSMYFFSADISAQSPAGISAFLQADFARKIHAIINPASNSFYFDFYYPVISRILTE